MGLLWGVPWASKKQAKSGIGELFGAFLGKGSGRGRAGPGIPAGPACNSRRDLDAGVGLEDGSKKICILVQIKIQGLHHGGWRRRRRRRRRKEEEEE